MSTDNDRPVYVEKTTQAVAKDFDALMDDRLQSIVSKNKVTKTDLNTMVTRDETMEATLAYNKAIKKNLNSMMKDIPKRHFYKALYIYYITMGETVTNALKLANPGKYKDANNMTCYRQGRMIEGELIYQKLYQKITDARLDFASRLGPYEEKVIESMMKRLEEEGDEMKPMARNQLEGNLLAHFAKRKEMKQKMDERININIQGPTQIQVMAPPPSTDKIESKVDDKDVLEIPTIVVQVEEENATEEDKND